MINYTSDRTAQRTEDGLRKFTLTFEAVGTHWEIETSEPLSQRLQERVLERIEAFDATYSRFRSDSLVSRIALAHKGGRFGFPDDSISLFDLYERLYRRPTVPSTRGFRCRASEDQGPGPKRPHELGVNVHASGRARDEVVTEGVSQDREWKR